MYNVLALMFGLICLAISGLTFYEGSRITPIVYLLIGIVCVIAYVVGTINSKWSKR